MRVGISEDLFFKVMPLRIVEDGHDRVGPFYALIYVHEGIGYRVTDPYNLETLYMFRKDVETLRKRKFSAEEMKIFSICKYNYIHMGP